MFLVEVSKAFRRVRTYVLGAGLLAIAILPTIVLAATNGSGAGGPPFLNDVTSNGLFGALTALVLIQPFFLPLGASLISGEAVALEASNGTLRYLLIRPVGRVRLIVQKYLAVMALLGLAVLLVAAVGLLTGVLTFGAKPMATLSGTTLAVGPSLLRIVASAAYVLLGVLGLAAMGVFFSTLTDSPVGAAGATMFVAILSQILDGLQILHVIHPELISHDWLAFSDLFRSPVLWSNLIHGLIRDGVYAAVFLGLAMWRMRRRDVTS